MKNAILVFLITGILGSVATILYAVSEGITYQDFIITSPVVPIDSKEEFNPGSAQELTLRTCGAEITFGATTSANVQVQLDGEYKSDFYQVTTDLRGEQEGDNLIITACDSWERINNRQIFAGAFNDSFSSQRTKIKVDLPMNKNWQKLTLNSANNEFISATGELPTVTELNVGKSRSIFVEDLKVPLITSMPDKHSSLFVSGNTAQLKIETTTAQVDVFGNTFLPNSEIRINDEDYLDLENNLNENNLKIITPETSIIKPKATELGV